MYSHFLLHFNPCPACLTFLRTARPFQDEVPSLTCGLGCHWAWILHFKTYWQENCRKISTSSSQSREVDGHRNGLCHWYRGSRSSPVTHMNLFWVKDLSLGKSHLYGRHGWPLDLTKCPNTQWTYVRISMPYVRHAIKAVLHTSPPPVRNWRQYPCLRESYGLMQNCPIKYNNGFLHRMSQGLTFCEKKYQLLIEISTVLNLPPSLWWAFISGSSAQRWCLISPG